MISVLIPTVSTSSLLHKCLKSLKEAEDTLKSKLDVLILDSGGAPDMAVLQSGLKAPRIADVERWWSFSKIINEGIKLASGDVICVLHDDCMVSPNIFASAHKLKRDEIEGAITTYHDNTIEQAGITIGQYDNTPRYRALGIHKGSYPETDKVPVLGIPFICGVAHRKLFEKLDGFDEGFHWSMESLDFCLRAWESGASVKINPDSVCEHAGGASRLYLHRYSPFTSDKENTARFEQRWLIGDKLSKVRELINGHRPKNRT